MVRLFLKMVQKFGYQQAKAMAPKFGIQASHIAKAEQQVAAQRGASGLQQGSFDKFYGSTGSPAQTFAQRKAARTAAPYNERMRQNITNRATLKTEREAAKRRKYGDAQGNYPDWIKKRIPGIEGGLYRMDNRASDVLNRASGGATANIDALISKSKHRTILEKLRGRINPEQLKKLALILGGGAIGYGIGSMGRSRGGSVGGGDEYYQGPIPNQPIEDSEDILEV